MFKRNLPTKEKESAAPMDEREERSTNPKCQEVTLSLHNFMAVLADFSALSNASLRTGLMDDGAGTEATVNHPDQNPD